jgi:hypothetical protein
VNGPLIAIIGSVRKDIIADDEKRAREKKACEELGRELGSRGCRILVYSSREDYIEADVVRGFAKTAKADNSIIHRHTSADDDRFQEDAPERQGRLFKDSAKGTANWKIAFYGSLKEVEGDPDRGVEPPAQPTTPSTGIAPASPRLDPHYGLMMTGVVWKG